MVTQKAGAGGALLIGQLLHVQSHRSRLVAELVVLRDVHVALSVAGVVGHPDCDRGARDGHLRATVDRVGLERQRGVGGGRGREERERTGEERHTYTHRSGLGSPLSPAGCPGASPAGREERACTGGLAGGGALRPCAPVDRGSSAVEGGRVS